MVNNFIGGGQVFLHKLRMFDQVFFRTLHISLVIGFVMSCILYFGDLNKLDWNAFCSYRKAVLAESFDEAVRGVRYSLGKESHYVTQLDAKSKSAIWRDVTPRKLQSMSVFKNANKKGLALLKSLLICSSAIFGSSFLFIFFFWSRFGEGLKSEKKKEGSDVVLTAKEVRRKLNSLSKASHIKIGNMPLVKNMETRHFLVTGSTGSGKTNLFHNILPQVEKSNHPAIILDQTGEMIAKYYNPDRGDIIFNPFDERAQAWDFWLDCGSIEDIERFSKILLGFNRKKSGHNNDPFWEQSAEVVLNACVLKLLETNNLSIEKLVSLVSSTPRKDLRNLLIGTKAARYLDDDGKTTANSILSVLSTSTKPLSYLKDKADNGRFSLKEYFSNIKNGSKAWLFLATKPSSRELTLPLNACLLELALTQLMNIGIDQKRRVWFVIDELASLGKLPALSILITEGRKYGSCLLAGIQSLSQIYENYGQHGGSSIFGQFGTSFFFRNNEPAIGAMVSNMCGVETVTRHQKNTSFGANEFRDGVSYNEHHQRKNLVEYSDLANLAVGECYVLLPEPEVRLAKIQIPEAKLKDRQDGFVQAKRAVIHQDIETDNDVPRYISNDIWEMPEEDVCSDDAQESAGSQESTRSMESRSLRDDKKSALSPDFDIAVDEYEKSD